jgi:Pyruvate/2-oxoacid:ferredoxin oxidoreductase delta subunit
MADDNYERIAEKLNVKPSRLMLDILGMIADPQEAELLLAMPGTPAQLSEKLGRSSPEVEAQCRRLYEKGLALKTFKQGALGYRMHKDITMFRDATAHWPDAPAAYHDLWKQFMEEEWPDYARLEDKLNPKARGRVIPIERTIASGKQQQVLDSESVDRIIRDAELLSVTNCICRVIERKCDRPLETCLQVNNSARYMLDRGIGREVSKQEAIDILRMCEEAGLVHMTLNKSAVDHFICNCCDCCCVTLPMVIKEGLNLCDPSRYQAAIDPELCSSCGTCLDRCYFGAIENVETGGEDSSMRVNGDKCMGCGLCHSTCPEEAIRLVEVREKAFIPE